MPESFFEARRPHEGMDYDAYLVHLEKESKRSIEDLSESDAERVEFTGLNVHRTRRINKIYTPSDELCTLLHGLGTQLWMVLTEAWCGDSAQNLPYIAKMAACNPKIELRFLLRDQNLDIIDQYLTDGGRGIPKLVAFDSSGNEIFRWGPRPREAAELFRREKAAGNEKPRILEKLHLWYGRDRGKMIDGEFVELLKG